MIKYCIYCLINSDKEIFYVGISKEIDIRIAVHKLNFGKDISFSVIDHITTDNKSKAYALEAEWVKKYLSKGHPLININLINGESKLKTVKVSERVHTQLKTFVAKYKLKNITSFVDEAIQNEISAFVKCVSNKPNKK